MDRYRDLASRHPDGDFFGIGNEFEGILMYAHAWKAMATRADPHQRGIVDWDGEDLANLHLIVEKRARDIGADLRMGRLLELAGVTSRHCTAYVEKRLVPLFRRSFPSVTVEAAPAPGVVVNGFDRIASYEMLGYHLLPTAKDIARNFVPLQADPNRVFEIRAGYLAASGGRPVVGLSWHSSNPNKDMPPLSFWAELVKRLPFTCVSVNYGNRSEDIAYIEKVSGKPVLPDPIDQKESLDDLAAQICAIDAVVSITNSTAHMTGSLGKPLHLMLSRFIGMTWPIWALQSPWYPTARFHRKNKNWNEEIEELIQEIHASVGQECTQDKVIKRLSKAFRKIGKRFRLCL